MVLRDYSPPPAGAVDEILALAGMRVLAEAGFSEAMVASVIESFAPVDSESDTCFFVSCCLALRPHHFEIYVLKRGKCGLFFIFRFWIRLSHHQVL